MNAKPDTIENVKLHVFHAGHEEFWVGRSAEDVACMNRDQCGVGPGEGGAPEDWKEIDDRVTIPIRSDDSRTSKTAGAWAKENGRGFLASTNT